MCGIAGLWDIGSGRNAAANAQIARAMTNAIGHRGPDGEGHWQDEAAGLVLGHRRLAIVDLSPTGFQPMLSHCERYVLSYNGEIYNFLELRADLEARGVTFKGTSDTEVMLAAFALDGVAATLPKLCGMFAMLLWDRQEKTLTLIRDPFGKKPLYIGWAGKSLLFASELKAFHAHPDFKPAIDTQSLSDYMRYASVQAPRSIFQSVWQLLPGHYLRLDLASLQAGTKVIDTAQTYFDPAAIVARLAPDRARGITDVDALGTIETVLKQATAQRMIADVPLGAFLSGGIDSSTIVALMQAQSSRKVKTFAIGFDDPQYNEAAFAARIAAHLGTDHQTMVVSGQDALDVVPYLPDMYDEPFADASQIPTHLVAKLARAEVTVALSGDGGDEMFGGYRRHFRAPLMWQGVSWMPAGIRNGVADALDMLPDHAFGKALYADYRARASGLLRQKTPQDMYAWLLSYWQSDAHVVRGMDAAPLRAQALTAQIAGLDIAEQAMIQDVMGYLPNDILVKVDRASMAVALEARAPFLDRRVFEAAWALPQSMKIRNGQGKWIIRELLAKYVPRDLFERPKRGFTPPLADWLRGPLKGWAEDLLSVPALQQDGLLDAAPIRAAWQAHLAGQRNHATKLWVVLMYQAWRARYR